MNSAMRIVVINPDNVARFGIRALLALHKDIELVGETSEYSEIPQLCKAKSARMPKRATLSGLITTIRIAEFI